MAGVRSVAARRKWFLTHSAGGVGWCARHTWRSLGGDRGNPPAWGASNANAVVRKLRAAGELRTNRLDNIPKGAIVVWEYGNDGHMALSDGPKRIVTTDSSKGGNTTGVEAYTYPKKWGAKNNGRPTGWADYYAGVRFAVGSEPEEEIVTEDDIRKIAKRVNETLGDYDAKGDEQDAASNPPKTGSTRLRAIERRLDALEG
jgi:hypothetical protein